MKTALKAGISLTLGAFLLAGIAGAQTASDPSPGATMQPPPGIIMTPPMAPSAEQSCPATGQKLELIS